MRATLNGGWFITGEELARYGKRHISLWWGLERAVVGNDRSRELCEALELAPITLQAGAASFVGIEIEPTHTLPVGQVV